MYWLFSDSCKLVPLVVLDKDITAGFFSLTVNRIVQISISCFLNCNVRVLYLFFFTVNHLKHL